MGAARAAAPLRCALTFLACVFALSPSAVAAQTTTRGGVDVVGGRAAAASVEAAVGLQEIHVSGRDGVQRGSQRGGHHHRRFLRQVNPNMNALDGFNPFTEGAQRTFGVQDENDEVVGGGVGAGEPVYDPMHIQSRVETASEALSADEVEREALKIVTEPAAVARDESVQQELKMLENLMLQELEVKRKLDASFQSEVAEEMTKSKAAIEEAKARERQLKVRKLELEIRLEKQMREQTAQLTSASALLTRQMGEAARQQQMMASDAAAAQAAAAEASQGSAAKAIDYIKNMNVTAAVEKIRRVRAAIADTVRSKDTTTASWKVSDGFNAGYETVQTRAEAARPVIVKLAESREALRNKIEGVKSLTLEHKRAVDEKFARVMAPRLQEVQKAVSATTSLLSVDDSTLKKAHKALSVHVAGALKGYNKGSNNDDFAPEAIAFLVMLLPLVGWLAACAYMVWGQHRWSTSTIIRPTIGVWIRWSFDANPPVVDRSINHL